jgi:hypothetical protein
MKYKKTIIIVFETVHLVDKIRKKNNLKIIIKITSYKHTHTHTLVYKYNNWPDGGYDRKLRETLKNVKDYEVKKKRNEYVHSYIPYI